jgi:hypothetical protein
MTSSQSAERDMNKKYRFLLLVTALLMLLSGCMAASTAVSGIGARAIYGETDYNRSTKAVEIQLSDAEVAMATEVPLLPYRSLTTYGKQEPVDVITLKYDDIQWADYSDGVPKGKVKIVVKGTEKEFEVRLKNYNTSLFLEHRYRRWYGYPAQGLLIVAVPIDAALNALLLGGAVLFAITGG